MLLRMNDQTEKPKTPAEMERIRRQERVAAALRANLLRRKEQARARAVEQQGAQDQAVETEPASRSKPA